MIKFPYNTEAEQAVIGSILLKGDLVYNSKLSPEDFYDPKLRRIYAEMKKMAGELVRIDILTVSERVDESPYMAAIMNSTPTTANLSHYENIVAEKSKLRKIISVGLEISELAQNDGKPEKILAEANKKLLGVRGEDEAVSGGKELVSIYEKAQIEYTEKLKSGKEIIGLSSGFKFLDRIIDGIRPGHLWVIGGATSVGKSFFAINILDSLLKQKKRVIFYSLEMSKLDITQRVVGLISGINGMSGLKGYTDEYEKNEIEKAKQEVYSSGLNVYKGEHHWNNIKLSMLEQHNKEPVDCFFIDYIQQIESDERSHYDTLRVVSKELQSYAQSLGVPVIAFSQLSNESINTKSDAIGYKGSGDIANSADLGLELRLDEDSKELLKEKFEKKEPIKIKLIARKNRHGQMGTQDLLFDPIYGKFVE